MNATTPSKPEETALTPTSGALSPMADSPLPVFTGAQMVQALTAYQELQRALDRSMPDQIMDLDGRKFRKKGYWRAIAVAFGLTVEPSAETRETSGAFADGRDNFGYLVTYRASAPNGRTATGDGSCFAVEKARRFKCPHPERPGSKRTLHFPHHTCPDFDPLFQWRTLPGDATEHNVRSHAHTRAFNRAVSNLCGFGEVSAEEVERDHAAGGDDAEARRAPDRRAPAAPQRKSETAAPAASAPATTAWQTVCLRVKDLTSKTGENDRGAWTRWVVLGSDDKRYGTFSASHADVARDAREGGDEVEIVFTESEKGRDIKTIAIVAREPGSDDQ